MISNDTAHHQINSARKQFTRLVLVNN